MIITFYSFLMSVLFSAVPIALIHTLRRKFLFLKTLGIRTILFLYVLCCIRAMLIFEFSFTAPFPLRGIYSAVVRHVRVTELPIGGSQVELLELYTAVWLSVAAILILQFLWQVLSVGRRLARYAGNKDAYADRVLERVKSESWRTPSVSLCVCPSIDIPMGAGLFKRRIYLPDEKYTEDELYYILKHEYTHFCNRDLLVKFIVQLFCCIFWWNPMVYLMKRDLGQILEIRCDAKATEGFSRQERAEYLSTIVRILKGKESLGYTPSFVQVTRLIARKRQNNILERFHFLTKSVEPLSRPWKVTLCAMAVGIFCFSYTFVIQPEYDPPLEDVYTNPNAEITDVSEAVLEDLSLLKDKEGKFYLVVQDGDVEEIMEMQKSSVQIFLEMGVKIMGE